MGVSATRFSLRVAPLDALVYIRPVSRAALITGHRTRCSSC
jgi:hypothetical protein